jgi:hypothetical protein
MKNDVALLKTINTWQRMPHNYYADISTDAKDNDIWLRRGRDWNVSYLPTAVMVRVGESDQFDKFVINTSEKRKTLINVLESAIPDLKGSEKERLKNVKQRIKNESNKKKFSVRIGCSDGDLEDQLGSRVEANIFKFINEIPHCLTLSICCPPVMDTPDLLGALREVFTTEKTNTVIGEHLRLREITIKANLPQL